MTPNSMILLHQKGSKMLGAEYGKLGAEVLQLGWMGR